MGNNFSLGPLWHLVSPFWTPLSSTGGLEAPRSSQHPWLTPDSPLGPALQDPIFQQNSGRMEWLTQRKESPNGRLPDIGKLVREPC